MTSRSHVVAHIKGALNGVPKVAIPRAQSSEDAFTTTYTKCCTSALCGSRANVQKKSHPLPCDISPLTFLTVYVLRRCHKFVQYARVLAQLPPRNRVTCSWRQFRRFHIVPRCFVVPSFPAVWLFLRDVASSRSASLSPPTAGVVITGQPVFHLCKGGVSATRHSGAARRCSRRPTSLLTKISLPDCLRVYI